MDVQYASGERREEHRRHDPIEAGEGDRVGAVLAEDLDESCIVARPVGMAPVWQDRDGHAVATGVLQAGGLRAIRHDKSGRGIETALRDGAQDRFQVRTTTGDEDGEFHGGSLVLGWAARRRR